jgi:hypothetical protein
MVETGGICVLTNVIEMIRYHNGEFFDPMHDDIFSKMKLPGKLASLAHADVAEAVFTADPH